MLIDKIKQLKNEDKYLSIYINSQELNKFVFGRIIVCNDNHVVMASYTPHGLYDGIVLFEIACICMIEYDNSYTDKMQKLISLSKEAHDKYNFKNDLVAELLKYSFEKQYIATIQLLNSGYNDAIGFVHSLHQEYFTIQSINKFGVANGYVDIQYTDVTQLSVDSIDEIYLKKLYEVNSKR